MPIVNHVVLASGAVAISVAVAAAIAMYESPELRRYADEIRQRIAMAFHSLGDSINPDNQVPRFNRPEDAEGFLQSRRGLGAEPGVDADDETRRRQREELMYWNSRLLQKKESASSGSSQPAQPETTPMRPRPTHRGSSFDDFMRRDETAEEGTYIFHTGTDAQVNRDESSGLRHRGAGRATSWANPFADEHHIDSDEVAELSVTPAMNLPPNRKDNMSDIYSATDCGFNDAESRTMDNSPVLVDIYSPPPTSPPILEPQLADDEYVTAGQEDRHESYASIQAWAQDSSRSFYSPASEPPTANPLEVEDLNDGQMTPTDSASVIGWSEVGSVANDNHTQDVTNRPLDVLSVSEGMDTPASWSEVGSVISDSEIYAPDSVRPRE